MRQPRPITVCLEFGRLLRIGRANSLPWLERALANLPLAFLPSNFRTVVRLSVDSKGRRLHLDYTRSRGWTKGVIQKRASRFARHLQSHKHRAHVGYSGSSLSPMAERRPPSQTISDCVTLISARC